MRELPNILRICTDQQRYDTINLLGNPYIHTPNLDDFCRQGVAFSRAYCQSPVCTPSRASFMTALYPSAIHNNRNGNAHLQLPYRARLISRHSADAGYRCGLSGKLHLSAAWEGVESRADDGYEEFWYSLSRIHHYNGHNQYGQWLHSIGKFDAVLDTTNRNDGVRRHIAYRENVPFCLHQTTWCADRAIDFLERYAGQPWFFCMSPFDPHPPFDAPRDFRRHYEERNLPEPIFGEQDYEIQERLAPFHTQTQVRRPGPQEMRDKASYYGMVELIDRNVGRLLEALDRTHQREKTIVVFTSDHGELLGDHGLQLKGCRFYEGLVRVPLIVSWPGGFSGGFISDALVELTDIAPTLADVVDIPLPWVHGKSLMPLLLQRTAPERHRDYVRCEYHDALAPHWGRNVPRVTPAHATMYRDSRYKISLYHGNEFGELYDLETDPTELNNLWEDQEYAKLRQRLVKESFDASMTITDPGSIRSGRW